MNDNIDIWYLIGNLDIGGTERTLVDLVCGLDYNKFSPVVWVLDKPGPLASELPDDVPLRNLDARHKADVSVLFRFAWSLKRERPDIIQSFLFFDNIIARLCGVVSPVTHVVTGVREVPNSFEAHRDFLDRRTFGLSDCIISNSEAGAEWVVRRGATPSKVRVVPNGRRVSSYDASLPDGYRKTIGVPSGPVVGTVGRLVKRKGHHDLLNAWQAVREAHPDVQLVIVGDGPQRDVLCDRAGDNDVAESVHLLGRRQDVPELLALFDIFAFPSHYEGMPGALLEAMCAGLPIVTTPVDGSAELIKDGEHGLYVPTSNPDALGSAIQRLLSDDELAAQLGHSAKERAIAEYSVEAMVETVEGLYDKMTS